MIVLIGLLGICALLVTAAWGIDQVRKEWAAREDMRSIEEYRRRRSVPPQSTRWPDR